MGLGFRLGVPEGMDHGEVRWFWDRVGDGLANMLLGIIVRAWGWDGGFDGKERGPGMNVAS